MKKFYATTIIAAIFFITQSQAQYIPDNGFAAGIANACPACIDAGHNLTADAQTLTSLNIDYGWGITDLTGLDGFTSLQTLICRGEYVTNFPALPPSLISLTCDDDGLSSLPSLPSTLQHLNCTYNYFTSLPAMPSSLRFLACSGNGLTSLPSLPSSCDTLLCSENPLSSLPTLPSNMKHLYAESDGLTSLPTLPSLLEFLDCGNNSLSALPALPNSLLYLQCNKNSLLSLPSLPNSLTFIDASENLLNALPALPGSLTYLDCYTNNITDLPTLTSLLDHLNCEENQLSALPALPSSLTYLDCSQNNISNLPTLPNSLIRLFAWQNQLHNLPALPNNLQDLECGENYLSSVPTLPISLLELSIGENLFTALPPLNPGLIILDCSGNNLVHLPSLPVHLDELYASNCGLVDIAPLPPQLYDMSLSNNALTSLPDLPPLDWFSVSNNPISCLPFLPESLGVIDISGTNINCVPNYPPYLNIVLPLCDAGNINGCMAYPLISGNIYGDFNSNGVHDNGEYYASHAVVQANPGGYVGISDSVGNYKIAVPLSTTDTTHAQPYSVYYNPPSAYYTATFDSTSGQQSFNNDFGLLAVNSGANLEVTITPLHFVPGFDSYFNVTIKNVGTTSIDGSVTLTFDAVLAFVSADQGGTSSANTVAWNFSGLNPFQSKTLSAIINCPSSVLIGTTVNNDVSGTLSGQTDIESGNNTVSLSTEVVGSFDPNEKEVSDATLTPNELSSGKYLEYTIHFQNTGTAPATFITVVDTLSDKLDATTFEMIAASHHYDLTLANDLTKASHPVFGKWLFNNIQLPDSSVDFANSQGFVEFRIKAKSDLLIGDEIENTAGIYFDFNEPVITNSANTAVAIAEGSMPLGDHHFTAILFPNPAEDRTLIHLDHITSSQLSLQVINEIGSVVMEKTISATVSSMDVKLDLKKFASGIYSVIVKSQNDVQVLKLVKE